MTLSQQPDRRTVLKTLGATGLGVTTLSGVASARPGRGQGQGQPNVLEITGVHGDDANAHHQFLLSDSAMPSGWTTIKFDNITDLTHFVYMVKLPNAETALTGFDGETLREQYLNAVTYPFQNAWDPYYAGAIDFGTFANDLLAAAPTFLSLVPVGGVGLTSPGETAMTTLNLEPGDYFLECYVLDDAGVFHSAEGMLEHLVVTDDTTDIDEPSATLDLSISLADTITFDHDQVRPGRHSIRVTVDDNGFYSNFLRHDVHLIRYEDGTTSDEVSAWIDYADFGSDLFYQDSGALTSTHDDPGPVQFLGGVQDIASELGVNDTAYMDVVLTPGEYAWVAEIPDPKAQGFVSEFTVGGGMGP